MPKKSGAQRKQASRAREKEQIGVEAFNEKNNADNRRRQSRIKEEAILAATEESGNGGGLSQMPDAIRRRKDRENRVSRLGKGTVQKESHDEYVDRKSRTVTFSKNVPPDIVNEWEEGALDFIKDHRQDVQDVGAKESDALALGSDVVALGSDSVALLSSMQKESDVVGLLSSMQSNVKGNLELVQEYKDDRNEKESVTEELVEKYMDSTQIVRRSSRSVQDSRLKDYGHRKQDDGRRLSNDQIIHLPHLEIWKII